MDSGMHNDMNNNDIGKDKPKWRLKNMFKRDKFVGFLDRQGFYVVLFICICVIGATALITTRKNENLNEEDGEDNIIQYEDYEPKLDSDRYISGLYPDLHTSGEDKSDTEDSIDIKVEDILTDEADEEKAKEDSGQSAQEEGRQEEVDTMASAGEEQPIDRDSEEEKAISGKMSRIMLKPVEGDTIIMDYAQDELIYSSTLKEWRTHPAIDIECQLGSEVRAVLDGVVLSIEEDPLMGIVITLDHGDGITTRYANLSTKDMVQVGQAVVKGQVISGVGRTATAEILDPPHLHFEVLIEDKNVDPKEFFE